MAKGMKHYFKDGLEHKGGTHKHPDGALMTGKVMSNTAKTLYHYKQLSAKARQKAKDGWGNR
jgi:hypothetical protein|tara:strand:- start:446 stop:631 length:186 start_codon:yes stop_codon:yes gene_type:complete